jgi:hypothetical protein
VAKVPSSVMECSERYFSRAMEGSVSICRHHLDQAFFGMIEINAIGFSVNGQFVTAKLLWPKTD